VGEGERGGTKKRIATEVKKRAYRLARGLYVQPLRGYEQRWAPDRVDQKADLGGTIPSGGEEQHIRVWACRVSPLPSQMEWATTVQALAAFGLLEAEEIR